MGTLRMYLLCTAVGLLIVSMSGLQTSIATETYSTTVEDGGTGPFKAILASDSSLPAFTIYRPKDLSPFGNNTKLHILAWGNGGCSNSNAMHQNYLSEIASHGFLVIAIGPAAQGGSRGGAPGGGMPGMMGGGRRGGAAPGGAPGAMPGGGVPGAMMGGGGMPGGMGGRGGAAGGARGGAGGGMGSGTQSSQLLDAITWAIAQDSNESSIYFGKIDTAKTAAAGHSCGGLQALEVSTDPRIATTLVVDSGILNTGGGMGGPGGAPRGAMPGARAGGVPGAAIAPDGAARGARAGAPGAGAARGGAARGARGGAGGGGMGGMPSLTKEHLAKLHGSVLYLLGGESDVAYANGKDDFKRIEKIPVFLASKGVGHGGTFTQPHGGDWARVSVAWLEWQLKGDEEAAKMFKGEPCGLAESPDWEIEKKNID